MSTKVKLVLSLGSILLLAILAVSIINYRVSRDAIRDEILHAELPLARDTIYSEMIGALTKPILVASAMANDTFLKNWTLDGEKNLFEIQAYLSEILKRYDFFSSFFVSSTTENYYYQYGILKTIRRGDPHDVWYYQFIDQDREYLLDIDTNQASDNQLTVFINHKFRDYNGNLLGVVGVGLNMDVVARQLDQTKSKYGCNVYFVDVDGLIQAHPEKEFVESANIREMEGINTIADIILDTKTEPQKLEYEIDGRHILLTSRFLPEVQWFLMVEKDENGSLDSARTNFRRTIIIGLIASVFVIFICLKVIDRFQKRLIEMACTDEMTGAANRREFQKQFDLAKYNFGRNLTPFSIILLDMNHLKKINDKHGHITGDSAIMAVARSVKSAIRPTDLLVRWGGDEFVVLTSCDTEGAQTITGRILELVSKVDLAPDNAPPDDLRRNISVSCGIATFKESDTLDSIIQRADRAMYTAKNNEKTSSATDIDSI